MNDNHVFNLINQLTQEEKSLWRIKNFYKKDASSCDVCGALWDTLEKEKENRATILSEILKKHLS